MTNTVVKIVLLLVLPMLLGVSAASKPAGLEQCRPLQLPLSTASPATNQEGFLWEISKQGQTKNYLFGTIHVADPRVLQIAAPVQVALNSANTFIMESLPSATDEIILRQVMFYANSHSLRDILDARLFQRTVDILKLHHLSAATVSRMKPWAAYLTMNYPPGGSGVFLDLLLLRKAQEQQMATHGLETLTEQVSILNKLSTNEQTRLLLDTICNYEVVEEGFEKMINLYLNRDLPGLTRFNDEYSFSEDALYKKLIQQLLTDRNYTMTERMLPYLEQGNAFVAIGALHLSGSEGVLSQLERKGFTVRPIY